MGDVAATSEPSVSFLFSLVTGRILLPVHPGHWQLKHGGGWRELEGLLHDVNIQRAVKAGARGYVLKDAQIETLTSAIRTVYNGAKVMDPGLMMEAWESDNPLSERELEVLRAAAQGQSTREMARLLCLSDGTIRNYLSEIISKLQVESRLEAVKLAEDKGWL